MVIVQEEPSPLQPFLFLHLLLICQVTTQLFFPLDFREPLNQPLRQLHLFRVHWVAEDQKPLVCFDLGRPTDGTQQLLCRRARQNLPLDHGIVVSKFSVLVLPGQRIGKDLRKPSGPAHERRCAIVPLIAPFEDQYALHLLDVLPLELVFFLGLLTVPLLPSFRLLGLRLESCQTGHPQILAAQHRPFIGRSIGTAMHT